MKKIFIYYLLLLALSTGLSAQTTITTVGESSPDYRTLKDAFDAINAHDLYGNVVLQIVDNTIEYGTAVLYESGHLGVSSYTSVTIYPTGPGLTIGRDPSMTDELLIDLNGADKVTFDGRVNATGTTADLTISNSITGTDASTIRFINSAQNNTIQYCNIEGSSTNVSGGLLFFSGSVSGTGNNGNKIDHNNITGAASGRAFNTIFSSGTALKENSGNSITNNNIYNFLNDSNPSNGIFVSSNSTGWTITGNSFYETTSFAPVTSDAYNIIKVDNSAGDGFDISDNNIGSNAALCGGTAWTKTNSAGNAFCAIFLNAGTVNTSNIQNNTIKKFSWSNSSNASWTAIEANGGKINIGTTAGNNIGETTGTGSIFFKGASTDANFYGIKIVSAGTVNCNNNSIGSVTAANYGATSSTNFTGIIKTAGGGTTTISNNIIGSNSTANSINANNTSTGNIQSVYGISNAGTGSITISGNTIANLNNGTTNSVAGTAGLINGISSTDGTLTISYNTIRNLSIANANTSATYTASVIGIALTGTLPISANDNTIYNLVNTNNSFAGSITGLYFSGGTGTNSVEETFVHDLSVTGAASTSASIYGIQIASGAATYSNNIVTLGGNTQTTIYGIYETGLTGNNNNIYFNTVYINGVPTSGAKNSYAIYSAVTTNTRNFRNNIFFNERSNNTATGKHYAAYFVSAGGSLTIDYNDYFATGTGGTLGYFAGDQLTLAAWKTATSQDVNSLNTDPSFKNAGGSSASDYMLLGPILTGVTITGFIEDYNDATRKNPPTMGAFEVGCTDPVSGGTIDSDQIGCNPFDPVAFTATIEPTGYAGLLEYKWQKSIINGSTGFTDIASSNSKTYNPGIITQTTWYKRVVRVDCKSDWSGAVESNVVQVTVNNPPTAGAISGGTALCLGSTLTLSPAASGNSPFTYTWSSSAGGVASVTNAGVVSGITSGSTNITYTVTDVNSCSATSPVHGVAVNALPATGLTVGGAGTICSGTPTNISVAMSVTGINYQLRNDNADELVGTVVGGTTGTTIYLPTGSLTTNTTFNVLAINATTLCSAELTQKATVNIIPPSAGGTISGTAIITYGSSSGTMTLSGYFGTILRWEKRYNSGSWTTISNTSATYSETPSSAGTWGYRAVVQNGSCALANSPEFSITVNKAALSVTAADKSKTYDGLVYSAFTVTYSGFVLGETSAVLGGSLSFSGTATTATNAGNYVITPGGLTSGNYDFTFVNGQLTINTAPLSVTAVDKTKAYDGLVYGPFTVTYSGFVNSETSTVLGGSLTFSGTAITATNVGSYVITPGGLTSTNYAITFVNGQLTISKAPLSITATDKSKTYDGSGFSPFTVSYSGFVNGESSTVLGGSLTFSGTATTATNAGSYVITPAGLTSGNYTITFVNGQLTINKASLSVTASENRLKYTTDWFTADLQFRTAGL